METATNDTANRSISIAVTLPASPEQVWEAWTRPEHIARWWGPSGFTSTIHTMEVSADGEWRLTMHGPDGKRYPNKSVFLEIVPLQKIVFQHFNPGYLATIVFEPGEKSTCMQWTMVFETAALFETVVKVFKAEEGLQQNVEKLERYLKEIYRK